MNKLDIKPFSIGFIPLCAVDTQEKKFYAEIKIDREATLEELRTAYGKALSFSVSFSVEIGYSNKDTIRFLIGKAGAHEKALESLEKEEKVEEEVKEKIADANTNPHGDLHKEKSQTPKEDKSKGEEK